MLFFFLYKQNRFLSCSFQRFLSRTTEREASRILERTTWCLGQKSTSGGHCRHQRPLGSSNYGFPGETSSTFSWVWSKLLGEGPPRWVVTKLSTWLPQTCPSLCRPSSLCLFFAHTSLFYSLFLSLVLFFCPFPPTPSFPVLSLLPVLWVVAILALEIPLQRFGVPED